jgi:hypothetical protein
MKNALTLLAASVLGVGVGLAVSRWQASPIAGDSLVRARLNSPAEPLAVERERINAAAQWLRQTNMWGMQRNGLAPASQAAAPASATKLVAWRLISIVSRPDVRAIVVQESDSGEIREVVPGAQLPDGSTLVRISAASITVQKAKTPSRTISVSALTQPE